MDDSLTAKEQHLLALEQALLVQEITITQALQQLDAGLTAEAVWTLRNGLARMTPQRLV